MDALADDELGLRLDALANLATAELYLHRYEHAGEHAHRGLVIARATGQGDISPILIPVLSHVLHTTGRIARVSAPARRGGRSGPPVWERAGARVESAEPRVHGVGGRRP